MVVVEVESVVEWASLSSISPPPSRAREFTRFGKIGSEGRDGIAVFAAVAVVVAFVVASPPLLPLLLLFVLFNISGGTLLSLRFGRIGSERDGLTFKPPLEGAAVVVVAVVG